MLLLIVTIILIACSTILGNIYFSFFSFQQNHQDLNNYYNSNYGAISSIERGLLSTKYMGPGYKGSGGFLGTEYWGNISDNFSGNFGKFTNEYNGLYHQINSKTNQIEGKISYDNTTTIILILNTGSNYYSGETTIKEFFDNNYISGYIKNNFDPISSNNKVQLKRIITLTSGHGYIVAQNTGNEILNDKINSGVSIHFASGTYNIFNSGSTNGSGFTNSGINYDSIGQTLTGGKAVLLQFYITGAYLKTNNGIVPNLDFKIESDIDFSDIYYYITGTAIVGKYKTEKNIKTPTSNQKNPNYKNFIFPNYN